TLGVGLANRIAIVNAVHSVARLEGYFGADFHRAETGRSIGGEVRIAGAGGEDDHAALLEMPDCAAANIGFADGLHLDGGQYSGGDADVLECVLQRERVD